MAENNSNAGSGRTERFASAKNPWLGLGAYKEGQQLYGRDKETAEQSDIIINHTASVVYGKSGIGKSSLLRAGVFPALRRNGMLPIYLRLVHNTEISYVQQIENAIQENITLQDLLPSDIPDLGLWDFLHRNRFTDVEGQRVTPVIVLDQFEEIFTLTDVKHKADVQVLFTELADVLNDVKPDRVIEAEAQYAKVTSKSVTSASGFTLQSFSKTALKYDKSPSFRFVFSLRDDSLYLLERNSAKIPAIKANRYNLCALDELSAMEVIMKPSPDLFTDKEGRDILDGLAYYEYDDYRVVDPAILSLFLYSYYQERGQIAYKDIFGRYYQDSTKDIKSSSIAYIEDHLLTERGNRNQIPAEEMTTAGVASVELELLLQRKILKTEKHKGKDYVEFSHDRLCEQALEHRSERKLREQARKMRKRMLLVGSISIATIGLISFFIWQNSRYLFELKRREIAESFTDSISKLNESLMDKNAAISTLNISLVKNNDSISTLNSELNEQVGIIQYQRDTLKNALAAKGKAEQDLRNQIRITNAMNDSLLTQMDLNEKQELAIKSIQGMALYNACIGMRNAVEEMNMADLKTANDVFKSCNTHFWGGTLRILSEHNIPLTGHFVFSPVFVDSLIACGFEIYRQADLYNKTQYTQGAIRTDEETVNYRTCIVGGSSTVKFSFTSRGHQELAFVTEPNGLISIRVYDKTHNKWYNYDKGLPYRFVSFELPVDKRSILEIEVINKTIIDTSFVIISN